MNRETKPTEQAHQTPQQQRDKPAVPARPPQTSQVDRDRADWEGMGQNQVPADTTPSGTRTPKP